MTVDSHEPGGDAAVADAAAEKPARARKAPRTRVVEIVFTPDQIAYLEERMKIVREIRPMRRAGGSRLRKRRPEGLLAT